MCFATVKSRTNVGLEPSGITSVSRGGTRSSCAAASAGTTFLPSLRHHSEGGGRCVARGRSGALLCCVPCQGEDFSPALFERRLPLPNLSLRRALPLIRGHLVEDEGGASQALGVPHRAERGVVVWEGPHPARDERILVRGRRWLRCTVALQLRRDRRVSIEVLLHRTWQQRHMHGWAH